MNNESNANIKTLALTNAINAVTKAENSKSQTDVNSALVLVNVIPSSTNKTNLLARLATIQTINNNNNNNAQTESRKIIEATSLTSTAYQTPTRDNYNKALVAVNVLTPSNSKTTLQSTLASILKTIVSNESNANVQTLALTNAINAVTKAENSKSQTDVNSALVLVNVIPSSTNKTNLLARLATIQTIINNNAQTESRKIIEATRLTSTAYQIPTRDNYNKALVAVNGLTPSNNKTTLQSTLASILKTIVSNESNASAQTLALANATNSVVKAEISKLQADVTAATSLIDKLSTGTVKTSLTNRINAVHEFITAGIQSALLATATAAVVKAEASDLQIDLFNGMTIVSKLPSGASKTALVTRISVVQATIN